MSKPFFREFGKSFHREFGSHLMPVHWPTHEDVLDVLAPGIIATCRSVVHGTAVCRTLGDASASRQQPDKVVFGPSRRRRWHKS